MSAVEDAIHQPKVSRAWMWALGVLSFCLLGYSFVGGQRNSLGTFAFALGYWLIPSGVLAAVFCAIAKSSRDYWWAVFGILYLSAIAGQGLGSQARQQEEAGKALDGMKESFVAFSEQMNTGPDAPPSKIELQPETTKASGDMGVMELFTKQLLNAGATIHNEYLKALEAAGWMKILDVDRLKSDPTMKESHAIIEAATAVVQEHKAKSLTMFEVLPERVKQAPFQSEASRRDFLKGLEVGLTNGRRNSLKTWDYEEKIVREYSAVIDVLTRSQGRYEIDANNSLIFQSDADAQDFNEHMAAIDSLVKEQAAHVQQVQAKAMEKLDEARQMAR